MPRLAAKSALLSVLLTASACGTEVPSAVTVNPPSRVLLATFTGEIDTEAGTVTIRSDDRAAPPGRGAIAEISAVTVANSGTPAQGNLCTGGGDSLGVDVRITANPYASTNLFTGVYAQIETLNGTGTEGCNGAPHPGGFPDTGLGLWSYPSLGGTNGVTAYWAFKFVSRTRSTFTGKVYGTATSVPAIKSVFVTSATWSGALGGLDGADAKCQAAAAVGITAGKLPTGSTYKAFLSTTTDGVVGVVNARDRFPDAAYVRPDGKVIAANKNELLTTGPRVPIQVTETGGTYSSGQGYDYAWTGSTSSGVFGRPSFAIFNCSNYTLATSSDFSVPGVVPDITRWADYGGGAVSNCATARAGLYCFQQ